MSACWRAAWTTPVYSNRKWIFSFWTLNRGTKWIRQFRNSSNIRHCQKRNRALMMEVRAATERELDHLAQLWHEGWQEAHAQICPAELRRLRTLDSFRQRLQAAITDTRVVGPPGAPLGLCITKCDELYQIYVSAQARGSGAAPALMANAGDSPRASRRRHRLASVCDRQSSS